MISLCSGWEFTEEWSEAFLAGKGTARSVRLPHTVRETPLHYAGPEDYEMVCGYRRKLHLPEAYAGKRLFLQFDGAAHIAEVYLNGKKCAEHRCGYTAFRVEITELARLGADNDLAVRLDCTENPAIPPFGFVIDYLTYGGLYREAWLDVRGQSYIEDVFVTTPGIDRLEAVVTLRGAAKRVRLRVWDDAKLLAEETGGERFNFRVPGVRPWTPETPRLYRCTAELLGDGGEVLDEQTLRIGFRTVWFKADGFYLNGKKTFLRGLNRHQSWPYIGYAAPAHLQREDARILKEELRCNAVRTSHYPQSHHFLDACDELGLLVFTEIPGWQHIGQDPAWKDQAVANTREMVLQYRNHPSIFLWGVRINESQDDDELYRRTNAAAHELDPSRPTSGVRYIEKSSLLEDVYAYNDFSHSGQNAGAMPKSKVTPDADKALLISECNGHMFPTKAFDAWEKRQEHALRHARVQDAAMASGEHAGCFGWCMFDYPTHKDFGSGDRICYHGVMDAFRNPKLAAALYASQGEGSAVLEIGSPMDIGDYPAGNVGSIYAFTNADEVALYKNDKFVAVFRPKGWKGLPHGPVLIDDTIGCLLETEEGFDGGKAKLLKEALNAAGKYGLTGMPAADKLKMLYSMLRFGMSFADGVALYGKYVGNWGGESTRWRFDARVAGETVASCTRCPGTRLHLEVRTSRTELTEGDCYDMAAVRVRVLDEFGNLAPYAQLPVRFTVGGPVELVGPDVVTAEGGMCGAYLRTTGQTGAASLRVTAEQTEPVTVDLRVTKERG
ncbi:MAG: glycoside hydrolase family 2 protein [Oscillospiraceae bacterium]|nr:glycoside hydrolase family 2 protein [Oscillospiraceae bacterium]